MTKHFAEESGSCFLGANLYTLNELAQMEMGGQPRVYKHQTATASLLITPEHENYEVLMRYTCEGMRFKLDEDEFSVTSFEMIGNNLQIWLEEVQ